MGAEAVLAWSDAPCGISIGVLTCQSDGGGRVCWDRGGAAAASARLARLPLAAPQGPPASVSIASSLTVVPVHPRHHLYLHRYASTSSRSPLL
eukprot:3861053-Rhodomonas_salina.1